MERKYIITIGLLAIGLAVGGFVLVRQHGGVTTAAADLSRIFSDNRQWMEIKPRTADTGIGTGDNGQTEDRSTGQKTAKAPKPVINWCSPAAAGQPQRQIIFNEIAWMGTLASYSDEWIELKNISGQDINLAGWQLQNKKQKIKISFGENDIIPSGGLYLLERTDDNSASGVAANKIYSGSVGNDDETLYLFDAGCQLQNTIVASPKWPAGDNTTKQTMARTATLLWQTSKTPGGTPGRDNF